MGKWEHTPLTTALLTLSSLSTSILEVFFLKRHLFYGIFVLFCSVFPAERVTRDLGRVWGRGLFCFYSLDLVLKKILRTWGDNAPDFQPLEYTLHHSPCSNRQDFA